MPSSHASDVDLVLGSAPLDALLDEALAAAKRGGATYAEVRFVDTEREGCRVRGVAGKDPVPEAIERGRSAGFGVRVLVDGAWGFSCTPAHAGLVGRDPDAHNMSAGLAVAVREAIATARATAPLQRSKIVLAGVAPQRGSYRTKLSIDPFTVPLERKVGDLLAVAAPLLRGGAKVRTAIAEASWTRVRKALRTSEGTRVDQELVYGGGEMAAIALGDDGTSQRRSYPSSHGGDTGQGGYERLVAMNMLGETERVRAEAVALLTAPPLPAGKRSIVLESSQLALQIHESCGHPTELDRALGTEISLAGGSFLQPRMLDRFRYGSSHVNLVADSLAEGGLGTFGWDDEGVPAGEIDLVREGIFTGYLSSRETAQAIGRASSGSMRADGWNRTPLIRMVNVSMRPGPSGAGTLDDLLAATEDGIYLETNKSWSIDDLRLHFQFGCEVAWEIKHGKRGQMYRDPVYASLTPAFWGSCDAVCDERAFRLWGVTNCGKGDPMQVMQVGHGAAPARFRDVEVGHT